MITEGVVGFLLGFATAFSLGVAFVYWLGATDG